MGGIFARIGRAKSLARSCTAIVFCLYSSLVLAAELKCAAALSGSSLRLENGVELKLAGITTPSRQKKEALSWDAFRHLDGLCKAAKIKLGNQDKDRYGRILSAGPEMQLALLQAGLARVEPSQADFELEEFFKAESEARKARKGIWELSYYAIRTPEEAGFHLGRFEIIEGVVGGVTKEKDGYHLGFGDKFRAIVPLKLASLMRKDKFHLNQLKGKKVRLRGWVDKNPAIAIKINNHRQIEVIPGG